MVIPTGDPVGFQQGPSALAQGPNDFPQGPIALSTNYSFRHAQGKNLHSKGAGNSRAKYRYHPYKRPDRGRGRNHSQINRQAFMLNKGDSGENKKKVAEEDIDMISEEDMDMISNSDDLGPQPFPGQDERPHDEQERLRTLYLNAHIRWPYADTPAEYDQAGEEASGENENNIAEDIDIISDSDDDIPKDLRKIPYKTWDKVIYPGRPRNECKWLTGMSRSFQKVTEPEEIEDVKSVPLTMPLYNPGNLCYANSVLQVLLHLPGFKDEICKRKTTHILKQLNEFFKSKHSTQNLLNAIQDFPQYSNGTQQDCNQFWNHLLMSIKQKDPTITSPFEGQLLTQMTCLRCSTCSEVLQSFITMTLFPHVGSGIQNTIPDMMNEFTRPKNTTSSCGKCQTEQQHTIETKLSTSPKIFTIQVQRKQETENGIRKIQTHVGFDKNMNLQPQCFVSNFTSSNLPYTLLAVIVHHGESCDSGHFTTYCWNTEAETWLHCNDDNIATSSFEEVQKSQAYMLVYTQQESVPYSP